MTELELIDRFLWGRDDAPIQDVFWIGELAVLLAGG
jgi:hypothetical protein